MKRRKRLSSFLCFVFLGILCLYFRLGNHLKASRSSPIPPSPSPTVRAMPVPAPPVAETPNFASSKAMGLRDLARWIEADSLCDSAGKYRRQGEDSSSSGSDAEGEAALYSALLLAHGQHARNPCAMALLAKKHDRALALASRSEAEGCRFLRALLLTDQLDGLRNRREPTKEELTLGRNLLATLGRADPGNGIYPFFELGALRQNEAANAGEAEDIYRALMEAASFTNPLIPLYLSMRDLSHLNATAYLYAGELFANANVPDYSRASKKTNELLAEDREPGRPLRWAQMVVQGMEEVDRRNLMEPSLLLIESAVLKSLAGKAWSTHAELRPRPPLLQQEAWVAWFRRRSRLIAEQDISEFVDDDCRKTLSVMREAFPRLRESDERQNERMRN
jgi:hypothetical protein